MKFVFFMKHLDTKTLFYIQFLENDNYSCTKLLHIKYNNDLPV